MYTQKPSGPPFFGGWPTSHSMGQIFQNMGQLGSRFIYIYMYTLHSLKLRVGFTPEELVVGKLFSFGKEKDNHLQKCLGKGYVSLQKVRLFFWQRVCIVGPFVSSKDGIWDFWSKNVWCKCVRWRVYPLYSFGHIQRVREFVDCPWIKLTNSPEEGVRWLTQSMWVLGRCMKNGPYPSVISGYHSDTTWYHYSQPSYSIGI